MTTGDLLLHPVRMRVLQALLDDDPLTTAQLRERLPDIPSATMYRHIAVLAGAGVLEVVDEKRVRGTVERSYRVRKEQAAGMAVSMASAAATAEAYLAMFAATPASRPRPAL